MDLDVNRILGQYDARIATLTRENILLMTELEQTREALKKAQEEKKNGSESLGK